MTKIIAFAGRKQSGKTTCAETVIGFVESQASSKSKKLYNFADPLKQDICMNILGLTYEQCYGTDDDKNTITELTWGNRNLSPREIMQFVGTDIFRKMKPNVWADATILKIIKDKVDIAIIADCRFPNEVEAVKNAGGIVVKLTRDPYHSTHLSETSLDSTNYNPSNFDYVLDNHKLSIEEQSQLLINYLNLIQFLS